MQQGQSDIERKFAQFLYYHSAYTEYCERAGRDHTDLTAWTRRTNPSSWIKAGFVWPHGSRWRILDELWQRELDNYVVTTYTSLLVEPKISFWINLKDKLSYLFWRLKFKRVQFYTLNNVNHCITCDANTSCKLEYGYVNVCKSHHQLKLRRKK